MGRKSRRVKFMEEVKKTRGDAIREGKRKAKEARQKEHEENSKALSGVFTSMDPKSMNSKVIGLLSYPEYRKAIERLADGKTYSDQEAEAKARVDEEMKKFDQGFAYKPPTKDSLATEPMKVICMELEWFEPKEALPVYNTTVLVVDDFNEMIVAARFLPDQGWLSLPADGEWESSRIRVRKWLRGLDPKVLEWEK